jgi:hypothetical protein
MKRTVVIARSLLSLSGVALIVLGLLFWSGRALSLVPLHMLLGVLLVVCLWVLIASAWFARVRPGFVLFALAWSLIVPVLGVAQLRLLPGSLHWLIQVAHFAVGFIAMGFGHALARSILQGAAVVRATPEQA